MPTGYTEKLKRKKYDVLKWLTEDIVRAFGVCVTLRDLDDMTKEEIENCLEKDCREDVTVNEVDLKKEYSKNKRYYKTLIKKAKKEEQKYLESKKTIEQMIDKNVSDNELLPGVLKYALEQLELIKDDFDITYYEKEVNATFEEFKRKRMRTLEYEKEYQKRSNELLEMKKQSLKTYKNYTKEVEELYNKVKL